jgi:hypothetical protein
VSVLVLMIIFGSVDWIMLYPLVFPANSGIST